MTLLRKSTAMVNQVTEVNVTVLWGEHSAVWLIGIWIIQGSLTTPVLQKRTEGLNCKGAL